MTYLDIFQDVARRTDKNPVNPDAATLTRINTFINDRYRQLMRLPGMIDLRDESFTFSTVANRARYAIPVAATAIVSIVDTSNRNILQQRPLSWIRRRDPSVPAQTTGTPWVYAILNDAGVGQQPSVITANALELLSTSASDTGVVEVEYQDADGGFRVLPVTLTGTTPVTVSATCVQVFRITNQNTQVGTIILRQIVSGAQIVVLPPVSLGTQTNNLHASRNWVLHLWPTPAGVYTYTVDGSRPRAALVEPMDEPAIPEDFHTLLVWGACEDEFLKMDDTRRSDYGQRWETDVRALRAFLHQSRGQRYVRDRNRKAGWSPMGSMYPPWQ
jgi:hypothetical protein